MNTPMTDVLELFIDKMSENEDLVKDVLELDELYFDTKNKFDILYSDGRILNIKTNKGTYSLN